MTKSLPIVLQYFVTQNSNNYKRLSKKNGVTQNKKI